MFPCGALPADAAVLAAGHEPNGYFWEGDVEYLAPGLLAQVELDPEAGMFCARGDRAMLSQLREELEPAYRPVTAQDRLAPGCRR